MHTARTRTRVAAIIAAIAIAGAPAALGEVAWQSAGGGNYHSGSNWSTMSVPGATDSVIFDLGAAYTVGFSNNAVNERLRVRAGQVTFNLDGRTYELTLSPSVSVQIGLLSGDVASLTVVGGQVQSQGTLIGAFGGSDGEMIVTGSAAQWTSHTGLVVGDAGIGALRVQNGAVVASGGAVTVGRQAGSDGVIEIGAGGSELSITTGSLSIGPSIFEFLEGGSAPGDTRGASFSSGEVALSPGGKITASSVNIGPNGSLTGAGVIDAASVSNDQGLLRASPGAPLRIEGQYFDTSSSTVEIEIGGVTPETAYAVLDVAGSFTPQGNLVVSLVNGYVPASGATFTIVKYAELGNLFNAVSLPELPAGREWVLEYGANSITLLVEGEAGGDLPADLNGDGRVNAQDLSILLGSWGPCPDPPAECIADINNDGRVNSQDLAELLSYWGQTSD